MKELNEYNVVNYLEAQLKRASIIKNLSFEDDDIEQLEKGLYILNKLAKKSRDKKREYYNAKDLNAMRRERANQKKLYKLKDDVMMLMIKKNLLKCEGYNVAHYSKDGHERVLIAYISILNNYKFHMKSTMQNVNALKLKRLKNIEDEISASSSISSSAM